MRLFHQSIRPLVLLVLAAGLPAYAADDTTEASQQLDPIIVEGQQSPLDSNAGRYRERLPCIGECADEEQRATELQQMLDNIKMMFIASQMLQKPEIYQRAPIAAPVDSRLNDKLP